MCIRDSYSGFDEFRPTFEEIMAKDEVESNWKLIDAKTGNPIDAAGVEVIEVSDALVTSWDAANLRKEYGFRLLPPKNVLTCLGIAIGGHAFWNGTSVMMSDSVIISLGSTTILIVVLLILARGILKGVRSLPAA